MKTAGQKFGLKLFGSHAVESMRIEKGYRHWKADLITEFNPFESALDRFVNLDKPNFIGKQALLTHQANASKGKFVTLVLECKHAPAQGGDSILSPDGTCIGTVTSSGWGYRVNKNIAMGFVAPAFDAIGTELLVEVVGEPVSASVVAPDLYDPEYKRIRS